MIISLVFSKTPAHICRKTAFAFWATRFPANTYAD